MTFAAPLFLLASLSIALPVVMHLIHRRKAREVRFSTLRFLGPSVQRTRRRKYLDDLSVLAARVGVLALIAVGLARPALTSLAALTRGGSATAVALVLDNSASMAIKDEDRPRFEAARQAAERVLALHPEGDPVALLLTCGPPSPELGTLHPSHESARQALAQARVAYERADLATRLREARALLARSETPNKEIYVVTDDQAVSWDGLKPGPDNGEPPGPPVILVPIGHAPMLNAALQGVTLRSPVPAAGVAVRATVEVRNTSAVAQTRHLELYVDGTREAVSPTLALPSGEPIRYEFRFTPDRPGVHKGEVRLAEDDASPLDNRLFFAIVVDEPVSVAVVKPRRHEIEFADEGFYLERALAPGGAGVGAVKVTTLTPEEASSRPLSEYAVVYCVNLPALPAEAAERLQQYAHDGGHVVWICGPNVQAGAYNLMNSLALGGLLPAALADPREPTPGGAGAWAFGSLDKDHPALAPLVEPASLAKSVLVFKHFPLSWSGSTQGHVLVRLDDGSPVLVERNVGSGTVLMLGTGLTTDWSNLPLKPLFLPLIARLTFHLAGVETERPASVAGAPLVIPVGSAAGPGASKKADVVDVEVVRPSGEVVRLRVPTGPTFRYADTHEPGVYLFRLGRGNPPKLAAAAINIDPAESDPATLTVEQVRARFGRRPLVVCETPEALPDLVRRLHEGTSLRDGFLAAVLVFLVVEVYLANRAGGRTETALGAPATPASATVAADAGPTLTPTSTPAAEQEQAIHDFLSHIETRP